jgi:hypothetical protein
MHSFSSTNTFFVSSEVDEQDKKGLTKFVLRGINPSQLDRNYIMNDIQQLGLSSLVHDLHSSNDTLSKVTTSLENIGISKARIKPFDTIVVNDDLNIRLFVSPVGAMKQPYSELRKHHCWFCRYPIPYEWHPIGIPLKHKVDGDKVDSFDCEGIFCSFNCCCAYLNEHHEYRFKDSSILLLMMYRKLFQHYKTITSIIPSPSWKLLKEYGGHLSIEDYRKSLQHIDYKSMQQMMYNLKMNAGSELFVEAT